MRLAGGGEDLPSGVAREWAAWGRSAGYLFDPRHGLDLTGYGRLAIPLRSYAFDDDTFAPRPAVEALLARYVAATREHRQVAPATPGLPSRIGHFGFFRRGAEPLWQEAVGWLRRALGPR